MGKINLGILPKLLLGILIGILVGSLGNLFNVSDAPAFRLVIERAMFTSLFSTFLQFLIPLLIVSFVAVGLADLGQKANKLFLVTLLLAYCSTVLAGLLAYFWIRCTPAVDQPHQQYEYQRNRVFTAVYHQRRSGIWRYDGFDPGLCAGDRPCKY